MIKDTLELIELPSRKSRSVVIDKIVSFAIKQRVAVVVLALFLVGVGRLAGDPAAD